MWLILWRRYVPFVNIPLCEPRQKVADGVCLDAFITVSCKYIFGNNDFGIVVLDLEQIPEFSLCGGFIIDS